MTAMSSPDPQPRAEPKPGEIKLIALDLDGTLLRHDGTVGEGSKKALQAAHDAGVIVALCSGRMTPSMEDIAAQLDHDVYIVSYNGAAARGLKASGRPILFEQPIPLDVALELDALAQKRQLQLNWYLDEIVYARRTEQTAPYIDLYIERTGSPYRYVDGNVDAAEHLTRAPMKVLFVVDPTVREGLESELRSPYTGRATVTKTDPEYLEFMHPKVDKGAGLRELCATLNVPVTASLAVGDSFNDEPLVTAAGWGVAMANAKDPVKQAACAVTARDCNHDGVAEALERWVLG